MIENPALFSRKDAATYVGLSVSTLDLAIARGMLRARRIGRRVLVPRVELDRFVRADHPELWPKKVNGRTTRHTFLAA